MLKLATTISRGVKALLKCSGGKAGNMKSGNHGALEFPKLEIMGDLF
jgi:hypothetical protein